MQKNFEICKNLCNVHLSVGLLNKNLRLSFFNSADFCISKCDLFIIQCKYRIKIIECRIGMKDRY